MQLAHAAETNENLVLSNAVIRAAKLLGLSRQALGEVIGRDRTSITRGISPNSKPGELALLLIRCYRALAVLVGNDPQSIKHWFTTFNQHTNGIPIEQVRSAQGLVNVTEYLDAMRGKL
ncbi:MAG: DUF2384 domain-containing protein [Methylococcales bacterium]|nr:DUF2384 domain-containing protein [Methylococcales bacterium]